MFKKLLMVLDFLEKCFGGSHQNFLEHLLNINYVPVIDILLENVKIKMKLVVKYNLLKYAENNENLNPKTN